MPSRASKTTKPCECGCGTPIPELGYNGKPRRFAKGHAGRVYYKGRVKPWLQASNEQKKPRHTNRGGIEGKACSLCITWKPLTEYSPRNGGQIENRCRACSAKRSLAYYHRHRDAIRKQRRSEEYKKYLRPYQAKWIKDRCQQDPGFRICRQLRSQTSQEVQKDKGTYRMHIARTCLALGISVRHWHVVGQLRKGRMGDRPHSAMCLV